MSQDRMPPVGHTDENGNFHWGSPADRARRQQHEESVRMQMGAEAAARPAAVHHDKQSRIAKATAQIPARARSAMERG